MKTHPYVIQDEMAGSQLNEISPTEKRFDETWLQELLRRYPNLLPTAEIETIFSPLVPIGREVGTSVGAIDNLFISQRGYLVMVETKLWRNPEARRDVLAQAIDYGASLSKWTFEQLDQITKKYTTCYENQEMGLTAWVGSHFGPLEGGEEYFEDIVNKNLRLGRFLTLIVGDRIRQSVIDMMTHVNNYPHLAMNVALIELACYRLQKNDNWPLVIVPNLLARTQIVERSVVQVTLTSQEPYCVEAVQDKVVGDGGGGRREFLTEDAYWDLLRKRLPEGHESAKKLIDRYRQIEGIVIEPSTGAIVARLDIQDTGEQATLFFIDTSGNVITWPSTIRGQITRVGFNGSLVDSFETDMSQLLKRSKYRCSRPILKLDQDNFNLIADAFIQTIQSAEQTST